MQKEENGAQWGKARRDLMERWPKDAQGQPEPPAFLADMQDTGGIADMYVAQLEAYDIPVLKKYENDSTLGRVVLGFSGYGVSLYVPSSRLEEAQALLETPAETAEEPQDPHGQSER